MSPGDHTLVLIARAELPQLHIEHVCSEVDASIALPEGFAPHSVEVITGFTEWMGTWRDRRVTLGWDWGAAQGDIRILSPAEMRTNIQLTADDGRAESGVRTRLHIAEWLDTQPWRETAIGDLVRAQGR